MNQVSAILLEFLQLVFWLVLVFLAWSWMMSRLFPKNTWIRRIPLRAARWFFIEPFRLIFRAIRWLVVKSIATSPEYRSHSIYLEDYPITPLRFYGAIEQVFNARNIIGAASLRIARREWHLLSTRRIYLLIRFRDAVCFIGGAALGTGFLISWRYTAMPGRFLLVAFQIPFIGVLTEKLLRPATFYRADIYQAFEQAVRSTVLEAVGLLTNEGMRPLGENEVRPLLQEFYGN